MSSRINIVSMSLSLLGNESWMWNGNLDDIESGGCDVKIVSHRPLALVIHIHKVQNLAVVV